MKLTSIALCFLFAAALALTVAEDERSLSEEESKELVAEAVKMAEATKRGDADYIIEITHPAILKVIGSMEDFRALTQGAFDNFKEIGLVFEKYQPAEPTKLYPAGDEEIVFVPTTSIIQVQGQRVKSQGYLVAIRPKDGGEWKFLDGSGFKDDPSLLNQFFPDLSEEVSPPEQSIEILGAAQQ